VQVKGSAFRCKSAEKNLKTCERFFTAEHAYLTSGGQEETVTRFAEIIDIFVFNIVGREFLLARASWFKANASHIETTTQTARIRTDLERDDTEEDIIEAKDINHQIALVDLPYEVQMAVVLDRRFDTLVHPGEV